MCEIDIHLDSENVIQFVPAWEFGDLSSYDWFLGWLEMRKIATLCL
jgi:hypothetical protein